jgi:sterol-4alpha-carboxylate 3-dehydrogenase (decarboxylating)
MEKPHRRVLQASGDRKNSTLLARLAYGLAAIVEFGHKVHLAKGEPAITRYRVKVPAQDFYFSSEKARKILGYRPKVDFAEAVKRTIEWYKSEMKPKAL